MPYETASGSALALVEALQPTYTSSGTFDTSSTPSLANVNRFLDMGSAEIAVMMVNFGYNQTQTNAVVLRRLEDLNARAACAYIEMSKPSSGNAFGPTPTEPTTRLTAFERWREMAKTVIESNAFSRLGATRDYELSAGLTHGGDSISDKETIEEDSDFERYRFERDMFEHPGSTSLRESTRDS